MGVFVQNRNLNVTPLPSINHKLNTLIWFTQYGSSMETPTHVKVFKVGIDTEMCTGQNAFQTKL